MSLVLRAKPSAIVLAAGKGTRMRSSLPKVLHRLNGRPLVTYPIDLALAVGAHRIVIVTGHGEAEVRTAVEQHVQGHAARDQADVEFERQPEQHGTGHAVQCALPSVPGAGPVLILSGDVPLLRLETIERLLESWQASSAGLAFAVFVPPDKTGYGRVVRSETGHAIRIVEERDATEQERGIDDCNAGVYCVTAEALHELIPQLGHANAQGEMYLTDLVALMAKRGDVGTITIDTIEAAGVNTPEQLEEMEAHTSGS